MMQRKKTSSSIATLIFFALIGLAFFLLWSKQFNFDTKTEKDATNETARKIGEIYALEPIVVELSGRYLKVLHSESGDRPRITTGKKYLKLAVDLELTKETKAESLETQRSQINKAVSEMASAKNAKDISTAEGKAALGNEIAVKLNGSFQRKAVEKVFFREFIIH